MSLKTYKTLAYSGNVLAALTLCVFIVGALVNFFT